MLMKGLTSKCLVRIYLLEAIHEVSYAWNILMPTIICKPGKILPDHKIMISWPLRGKRFQLPS
jgi:hypothetical protein